MTLESRDLESDLLTIEIEVNNMHMPQHMTSKKEMGGKKERNSDVCRGENKCGGNKLNSREGGGGGGCRGAKDGVSKATPPALQCHPQGQGCFRPPRAALVVAAGTGVAGPGPGPGAWASACMA
jgi:hypothetical protein